MASVKKLITIDEELLEELEKICKEERRSVSNYLCFLAQKDLEERGK